MTGREEKQETLKVKLKKIKQSLKTTTQKTRTREIVTNSEKKINIRKI